MLQTILKIRAYPKSHQHKWSTSTYYSYLYHIQILKKKYTKSISLHQLTTQEDHHFRPNDFNNPQTTNSFPLWIGVSLWRFIQGTPTKPPRSAPSSATNHSWRVVLPRVEELERKVRGGVVFRCVSFPIGWFSRFESLIFQGVAYNVHTYIEYTIQSEKTTPSSSVQWFFFGSVCEVVRFIIYNHCLFRCQTDLGGLF